MIFVDTSHLLALAMPSDGLHEVAAAWSLATSGPFLTTEFVLLEFVNSLSLPSQRPKAHAMVASIFGQKGIHVVPADSQWLRRGLTLHKARPDKAWSLTDCISFEVMRDSSAKDALTYDQHFEQAGFRALLRHASPA